MAERRMFAKTIIDSDAFLDMPLSTQALYFHLSMRADDEGFVNNPKKIARMIGADDDSLKLLIMKNFIIPFESGIVVIKHWKIHNYIRNDRYKPTVYQEERSQLTMKDNGAYTMQSGIPNGNQMDTNGIPSDIPDGYRLDTQYSIGKVSIDQDSINMAAKPQKHKHGEFQHVLLTDAEYQKLISDFGEETTEYYIKKVDEYCEQSGKRYKNYNLAIRNTFMKNDRNAPRREESNIPAEDEYDVSKYLGGN